MKAIGREGVDRPPIERMRHLAALLRSGKRFTVNKVAAKFELSPKTISRDLLFMRDRLRWTVDFDKSGNTYKLISAPAPVL